MTYSLVIYDPELKAWGVGVASKFLAVGAVVPHAKPNVGAVATQAMANARFGPMGLELLKERNAREVVEALISSDQLREQRQIGVVDRFGNPYAFTGSKCKEYAGHMLGSNFSVQGNILVGPEVLEVMAKELEGREPLHWRIYRALEAGERMGGDRRGKQSAAILVVKEGAGPGGGDKYVDIRVDDSLEPMEELKRLLKLWESNFLIRM